MCFQRELATIPVRYVHYDVPKTETYTLHSVGKHGFGESMSRHMLNMILGELIII